MAKYWRVDYEGDMDKQFMLEQGRLAWPRDVSADDRRKFGKQMKVGNGVLMGRLRGKRAMIDGIGRITAIEPHPIKGYEVSIDWQALPITTVVPDKTGLPKWKKYPVFRFADAPAERHQFDDWMQEHLGETKPKRSVRKAKDGVTAPMRDLISDVLATFEKPFSEDVTLEVAKAIEQKKEWRQRYDEVAAELSKTAQDENGEGVANVWLGQYVAQLTNMESVGTKSADGTELISTYSVLQSRTP